jgi:transcriptional regulator with XRE-family HTH domain
MSTHSIRERIFVNARMNPTLTGAIHACIVASMDKNENIGDRLDGLMQGHTVYGKRGGQSALARATGVPQPTINRILSNKSVPESETARKLAGAFGVSITWLLSGEGPKFVRDLEEATVAQATTAYPDVSVTEKMDVEEMISIIKGLEKSGERGQLILRSIKGFLYLLTNSQSAEDTTREGVESKARKVIDTLKRASKESESGGHGTATKRGAGRRHKP